MYYYQAYGLNIRSEISCPLAFAQQKDVFDVEFRLGKIPKNLLEDSNDKIFCKNINNDFFLQKKDIARFLIKSGSSIIIEPLTKNLEIVKISLFSSAIIALLHQRNYFVLHANAVVINNQAILVAACSGTGKSTLAAAFLKKGYKLLADDICAIKFHNGKPFVYSGRLCLHLCNDVIDKLGFNKKDGELHFRNNKLNFQIDDIYLQPMPLAKIFILEKADIKEIELEIMGGQEKVKAILKNTLIYHYVELQKLVKEWFTKCFILTNNIPMYWLKRPKDCFSAFDLVDKIIDHFNEK